MKRDNLATECVGRDPLGMGGRARSADMEIRDVLPACFPEPILSSLCCECLIGQSSVVSLLCFCGWDVAERVKQAAIVEPIGPFERGKFGWATRLPRGRDWE